MNFSNSAWLVIFLALITANLPFVNQRILGVIPIHFFKIKNKLFILRLVEWLIYYVVNGGLAYVLETKVGNVFTQTWEFYAITICLFMVFAYPGFCYCYLRRASMPFVANVSNTN